MHEIANRQCIRQQRRKLARKRISRAKKTLAGSKKGGMIVDAELLCTVIATMGTKSLSVLIFIFVLLFSKKLASAIESAINQLRNRRHFLVLQVMKPARRMKRWT